MYTAEYVGTSAYNDRKMKELNPHPHFPKKHPHNNNFSCTFSEALTIVFSLYLWYSPQN